MLEGKQSRATNRDLTQQYRSQISFVSGVARATPASCVGLCRPDAEEAFMQDFYETVWWWRDVSKRGSWSECLYDALIEKALKRGKPSLEKRSEYQHHHVIP